MSLNKAVEELIWLQRLLLMMHGRKTACIFHNAYFDIGVMICSAALSLSLAAGFISMLSVKRAAVSLHAAAYVPTYAWRTLRKLLLTCKERKAVLLASGAEFTDVIQKNIYLTLITAPKNSYRLLRERFTSGFTNNKIPR